LPGKCSWFQFSSPHANPANPHRSPHHHTTKTPHFLTTTQVHNTLSKAVTPLKKKDKALTFKIKKSAKQRSKLKENFGT
jgi:hypothetical protein